MWQNSTLSWYELETLTDDICSTAFSRNWLKKIINREKKCYEIKLFSVGMRKMEYYKPSRNKIGKNNAVKNQIFSQKLKFFSKSEIFLKNRNFSQKSKFFLKNWNYAQKNKFCSKIQILSKKMKFFSKIEFLLKNRNFAQKSRGWFLRQILLPQKNVFKSKLFTQKKTFYAKTVFPQKVLTFLQKSFTFWEIIIVFF